MKEIKLSGKRGKGSTTIVDDDIFTEYSHLTWYLSDQGYAIGWYKGGKYRLHRLIMKAPKGMVVDHLNHNKLDNRKKNLRVCTQRQNSQNRKDTIGYTWDKSRCKWYVQYKGTFYGRYETEAEAKRAYKLACSGVPYAKKRRKYWHLPPGVTKRDDKYLVYSQENGKRLYHGTYNTIREAQDRIIQVTNLSVN